MAFQWIRAASDGGFPALLTAFCEKLTNPLGETHMDRQELLRLARVGAQARIDALQSEIDAIHRQFPGLSARRGRAAAAAGTLAAKRRLSPAARKRISDAAKKRWTEWRKKNKKD
jgi:hypothetical protein